MCVQVATDESIASDGASSAAVEGARPPAWTLLRHDVFRRPCRPTLFAVVVGSGAQVNGAVANLVLVLMVLMVLVLLFIDLI